MRQDGREVWLPLRCRWLAVCGARSHRRAIGLCGPGVLAAPLPWFSIPRIPGRIQGKSEMTGMPEFLAGQHFGVGEVLKRSDRPAAPGAVALCSLDRPGAVSHSTGFHAVEEAFSFHCILCTLILEDQMQSKCSSVKQFPSDTYFQVSELPVTSSTVLKAVGLFLLFLSFDPIVSYVSLA